MLVDVVGRAKQREQKINGEGTGVELFYMMIWFDRDALDKETLLWRTVFLLKWINKTSKYKKKATEIV